jgi:hypothetical protein
MANPVLGDIGTVLRLTLQDQNGAPINLGPASTLQILLRSPAGVWATKTATLTNDGSDGKLQYATLSGDLSATGRWRYRARVVIPQGTFSSESVQFSVDP